MWFHKQHLAKKFENSSIMVATNYSLSIPTSSGMSGFWGFGFGVGLTWDYLSMRGVFDIQATANTKGASGNGVSPLTLWIKAGYHYAFNNYVYAGLELNWDSSIYSSLYNGYSGSGSHNVYLGPILSFKDSRAKWQCVGRRLFLGCRKSISKCNSKSQMERSVETYKPNHSFILGYNDDFL